MTDPDFETFETKDLTKATNREDIGKLFDEFMSAFEEFKHTNNARLQAIESAREDVLVNEKIERINNAMDAQKSAIDQLISTQNRPALGVKSGAYMHDEYKDAFAAYMRKGEEKSMSTGSNPDGGYVVPDETDQEIGRRLAHISPIRAIASIRQVSGAVYKKPVAITGPSVGWVGETEARPQTNAASLAQIEFPTMELYAMPAATASFLDDAAVDVAQWIAEEIDVAFAQQETAAFINGDGIKKPKGFLQVEKVAETNWKWGKIGFNLTGAAGALPNQNASDPLIDLVYALKSGYRQNATWVMNRRTQGQLRKLKDADGNYLWQPSNQPGMRPRFMGFDLVEAEDMPDIGANTTPIAFGDFKRGYLVVDRLGVNVIRDPYTAKPYVLFYTTKRVGGGVLDFDAIKLLKFAAS